MDRLEEIDGLIMLYFHSKIDGEITDIAVEMMNEHVEWMVDTIRDQQATIDSLSMAHDAIHREIPKDKHTLIKNIIGLNKRAQELGRDSEYLRDVFIPFLQANVAELERQNKHYREIFDELASLDEPNHDEDFYGTNEFFMKFNKLIKRAYEGELV